MQIKGTLTGDITKKNVVANKTRDGKTLQAEVDIALTENQATKAVGPVFAKDAFASLRDVVTSQYNGDATERLFAWGEMKPTRKIVCQQHRVTFTGDVFKDNKIELQPKLLKVLTVENAEKIILRIRLSIPTDRRRLSQNIEDACGGTPVRLKFEPMDEVTPDLPLRAVK